MTVGAVVVSAGIEEALADAGGRTAVRRIVDAAWAGGALPIIVVSVDDADGGVTSALEGSPAQRIEPGARAGARAGAAAYRLGAQAALDAVRETRAVLLWPGRMTWVDPETVTSLIEAHGRAPDQVIRPQRVGQAGWPVLVPAGRLEEVLGETGVMRLDERLAETSSETVELGDPGSVLGNEVAVDDLPDYSGPPEPVGGPPPEWGAAAADTPEPDVPPGA
jgi:CTP:molybdopterin cytidylyltransferase MocA